MITQLVIASLLAVAFYFVWLHFHKLLAMFKAKFPRYFERKETACAVRVVIPTGDRVWIRMYTSVLSPDVDVDEFYNSSKKFQKNNHSLNITGTLYINKDTKDCFQILEGPRSNVDRLLKEIYEDPRHTIQDRDIGFWAKRTYSNWGMAPFLFHINSEGSRVLWKQLCAQRMWDIQTPHWGNLFNNKRVVYFATTLLPQCAEGDIPYWTRPFAFVQVVQNGNDSRMIMSILRRKDGSKKRTILNLEKHPYVTLSVLPDWANDHFMDYFERKYKKNKGGHWFDCEEIQSDSTLAEAGFHFGHLHHNGSDYVDVFPAEKLYLCEASRVDSYDNGSNGLVGTDIVRLEVRGIAVRDFNKPENTSAGTHTRLKKLKRTPEGRKVVTLPKVAPEEL